MTKKFKQHTVYRLKNGTRVPGVTTITGKQLGWNTRVLVDWANRMGLQGIDTKRYVDDKASIGTLAHALVTDALLGKATDTSDYTENQITEAKQSAQHFPKWLGERELIPIEIETPMISEQWKYGGTPDIIGNLEGRITLIDLKTGKGIFPEMLVQVAGGYNQLSVENGIEIEDIIILNIPRDKSESFMQRDVTMDQREACWDIFKNCLDNHYIKKRIKL